MARKKKVDDWIERLSLESGINKNLTEELWNTFLDIIDHDINTTEKNKLEIPGFGTFYKAIHKGHPVSSMRPTDKSIEVYDYEVFKYKVSSDFKKRILNKPEKKVKERKDNE